MAIDNQTLQCALTWRYATKVFDASKKIDESTWAQLEDALVLTPSSYGMQPWKFLVVQDDEIRAKLREFSWGQSQVTDCSHHVVFLIKEDVSEADVDDFVARIAEVRGVSIESLEGYKNFIMQDVVTGPRSAIVNEWATRQVYIALGNFMTSASLLGVDTCPLEGIEPANYDKVLGLEGTGYRTVVACAAGYRAEEDKYAQLPKVRFEKSKVIEHR